MRGILKAFEVTDRTVWVADSFEGLPEPDAKRFPLEARVHAGRTMKETYGHFAVSLDLVRDNFRRYDLLDEQVQFVKGWFKDSLPSVPVERLAMFRLDGDYYESTMDALTVLYPKVSPGGYVIVDDYGEDRWTYCRKAIHDFRERFHLTEKIVQVDSKCAYWRRAR
jgi:O-methyltransferase